MKLYESYFLSLGVSLLIGALLFIGVPFVFELITMSGKELLLQDYTFVYIGMVMYVVYSIIQFWLSSINLIQTRFWRQGDHFAIDTEHMLYKFIVAEFALYIVVFVAFAILMGGGSDTLIVLLFSIPYIICCTASVYIYRYILIKLNQPQPYESQDDTARTSGS